jgi:hypothetical protein
MKLLSIMIISLFLVGCSIIPVKQKFPEAPKSLLTKCLDLIVAGDNAADINEFLKIIIKNYQLHYECSNKNDGWIEWYTKQKKTFEKANK